MRRRHRDHDERNLANALAPFRSPWCPVRNRERQAGDRTALCQRFSEVLLDDHDKKTARVVRRHGLIGGSPTACGATAASAGDPGIQGPPRRQSRRTTADPANGAFIAKNSAAEHVMPTGNFAVHAACCGDLPRAAAPAVAAACERRARSRQEAAQNTPAEVDVSPAVPPFLQRRVGSTARVPSGSPVR